MLNDWDLPKMSVFGTQCAGHEGAGVIVKVGDQVKNLKPGMRAGYKVSLTASLEVIVIWFSDTHDSLFKIPAVLVISAAVAMSATAPRLSSPD